MIKKIEISIAKWMNALINEQKMIADCVQYGGRVAAQC